MARFLFTTWPYPGHLYPNIAIAHVLRAHGHECAFYTGGMSRPVVEGEAFTYFPFQQVAQRLRTIVGWAETNGEAYDGELIYERLTQRGHDAFSHEQSLLNRLKHIKKMYYEWSLGTVPPQVEDLESVMDAWSPDVVVCDPGMWGPILVLHEMCSIPVAVSSFVPGCMIPGPDAPPPGLGLPPPRKWHTRLLARLGGTATNFFAADFRDAVNEMRQHYGLSPLTSSIIEYTGQMPLYLVPSAPEFDYNRRDLPPSVHYIGSCVWNKPHHEPTPSWLAEIPKGQPWVHVTEGTCHMQAPIVLRAAAQGLAHRPMQVIMTTGGNRNPEDLDLGPIAANVRVERWVAHSDLLPHTDVVVTTGGAGTVMAALCAGVPLIVVPTEWDKPENAQRVVAAGAGLRLSPRHCTPERLHAAVEQVLGDPTFRQNAQRLATTFSRYGGADRAAELLESLAPA